MLLSSCPLPAMTFCLPCCCLWLSACLGAACDVLPAPMWNVTFCLLCYYCLWLSTCLDVAYDLLSALLLPVTFVCACVSLHFYTHTCAGRPSLVFLHVLVCWHVCGLPVALYESCYILYPIMLWTYRYCMREVCVLSAWILVLVT